MDGRFKTYRKKKDVSSLQDGRTLEVDDDSIWSVEDNQKKQCKFHNGQRPFIRVGATVVQKVQALSLSVPDTEFLVYLLGSCTCKHIFSYHGEHGNDACKICSDTETPCAKFQPDGKYKTECLVTDVYIPNQVVTSGSVHQEGDDNIPIGIIGALHKHPGDGSTRFSCIDDESLNVNHDISIVIPATAALKHWYGTVRQNHPCGCNIHSEAKVQFLIVTEDVIKGIESRIVEGKVYHRNNAAWDWNDDDGDFRDYRKYAGGGHGKGEVQCRDTECTRWFINEKARNMHEQDKHKRTFEDDTSEEEPTITESYGGRD